MPHRLTIVAPLVLATCGAGAQTASPGIVRPAVGTRQIVRVPNNPGDDTAALTVALASVGMGPATVLFLAGQYDLYSTAQPVGFQLTGKADIEIRGASGPTPTILNFHNFDPKAAPGTSGAYPTAILALNEVAGITIQDLSIWMTREPYSSGIVVDKDTAADWIEIEMEQDYTDLADGFQIQRIDDFDPVSRRLTSRSFTVQLDQNAVMTTIVATVPKLRVRVSATPTSPDWFRTRIDGVSDEGDTGLLLMHSKYRTHFVSAKNSSDLVVRNVTIRDLPGMAVVASNCVNVTVDDLDFQPKAGRLLSITADGVHLADCTGAAVVRNCSMVRMGDDGLNTHSKFLQVSQVPVGGSGTVGLRFVTGISNPSPLQVQWAPGDTVEFYGQNLQRRGSAVLSNFQRNPFQATFDAGIPPGLEVNDLAGNPDRAPASVLVEDCVVEDNIARGLTLHGRNITVRGCTFRRNTGPAINLECELVSYYEASPMNGVTIENCLIEDSNRYAQSKLGAITINGIHTSGAAGPPPPACTDPQASLTVAGPGVHRNITIANNVFTSLGNETLPAAKRAVIWVTSSDAVRFNSNQFLNIQYDAANPNQNILRIEKTTNWSSDGNNCVSGFPGTWFKVICSPAAPDIAACRW